MEQHDDLRARTLGKLEWECDSAMSSREGSGEDPAVGGSTPEPRPVRSLSKIIDLTSPVHLQPFDVDGTKLSGSKAYVRSVKDGSILRAAKAPLRAKTLRIPMSLMSQFLDPHVTSSPRVHLR